MGKVVELTDEQYAVFDRAAQARGVTLSEYFAELAERVMTHPEEAPEEAIAEDAQVFDNLHDFFRSLGATDEDIAEGDRIYRKRNPNANLH